MTNLRIHHWISNVRDTLGPGLRSVVWVQGCTLKCPGCMVPETWAAEGGQIVDPEALLAEMLANTQTEQEAGRGLDREIAEVEGITVSGGEPTEQPEAVAKLLAAAQRAGKNTWVYSGYRLEELAARNDPAVDLLLAHTDVLVDGRYEVGRAGTLAWRGSQNQRILRLSERIPASAISVEPTCRVEVRLNDVGELLVIGVPPPGFLKNLRGSLAARNVHLSNTINWR